MKRKRKWKACYVVEVFCSVTLEGVDKEEVFAQLEPLSRDELLKNEKVVKLRILEIFKERES